MDLFAIAIGIILGLLNIFLKRQGQGYNICRILLEKHYSNLCKTHGKEAVSFCFEKYSIATSSSFFTKFVSISWLIDNAIPNLFTTSITLFFASFRVWWFSTGIEPFVLKITRISFFSIIKLLIIYPL